ncbi:hypothetical protein GHT06_007322 [Daphnia sinensis]|uniref:Uncharacterized protein n=1 Tax=Daphnia sinensis TaxID=1820382 RepID=A0AAD5PKH6_9CRUS|nr:hypothetical protein GHT06_007322 [Daphnia sinensis]
MHLSAAFSSQRIGPRRVTQTCPVKLCTRTAPVQAMPRTMPSKPALGVMVCTASGLLTTKDLYNAPKPTHPAKSECAAQWPHIPPARPNHAATTIGLLCIGQHSESGVWRQSLQMGQQKSHHTHRLRRHKIQQWFFSLSHPLALSTMSSAGSASKPETQRNPKYGARNPYVNSHKRTRASRKTGFASPEKASKQKPETATSPERHSKKLRPSKMNVFRTHSHPPRQNAHHDLAQRHTKDTEDSHEPHVAACQELCPNRLVVCHLFFSTQIINPGDCVV